MAEFTGERVIPGQVDPDLWNEHTSRYDFARDLASHKRVLDIGCGAGYGTAHLAATASLVCGVDLAPEALAHCRQHFSRPRVHFCRADATALPFAAKSFDLAVALEVIEHLEHWRDLLLEADRVLKPAGQLVVSTPNKLYYAESRQQTGPTPFHVHEFEFAEFREALSAVFPHVSLYLQNHTASIVFQPLAETTGSRLQIAHTPRLAEEANFFVAVCSRSPQTGSPFFVNIPRPTNLLRERNAHIRLLESELQTKTQWLNQLEQEHEDLVRRFRALKEDLEQSNQWASGLESELASARRIIAELNELNDSKDAAIGQLKASYDRKIASLEEEAAQHARWATETQQQLDRKAEELAQTVALLTKAEQTVIERTQWAQRLNSELETVRAELSLMEASRWIKLGRAIGLGPKPRQK